MLKQILFYLTIILSNIVQCITGFAGTVLAMPFAVMTVGIATAKPIINCVGIAASVGVLLKHYRNVNKKEFLKIIAVMGAGMIAGLFVSGNILNNERLVHILLGSLVVAFAVYNAILFFLKVDKPIHPALAAVLLVLAGLIHGIFVCGGPLLVTYIASKIQDKQEFRATLSAVWIVLNSVILVSDVAEGRFTLQLMPMLAVSLVLLVGAVIAGEKIAKKMNKEVFMIVSYALMLISGASLIFT